MFSGMRFLPSFWVPSREVILTLRTNSRKIDEDLMAFQNDPDYPKAKAVRIAKMIIRIRRRIDVLIERGRKIPQTEKKNAEQRQEIIDLFFQSDMTPPKGL